MFPLVSILVPAYNVAQYLHKCLDSIVNQTYQQLQVVVVDDGSSDNSLSIVKDYAAKYPFVEVYHQENAGVAAARNNLLSHVKGDYILFVDSDDWLELDMIEFLISKIEKYKVDVVTCGMVVNDTAVRKEYKQECWNQEVAIQKFLFHKELSGSLCNKLVLTSLLHNIVFHCGISYGEDALYCYPKFRIMITCAGLSGGYQRGHRFPDSRQVACGGADSFAVDRYDQATPDRRGPDQGPDRDGAVPELQGVGDG